MTKQSAIQKAVNLKCKRMLAIRCRRDQKRKENMRPSKVKSTLFDEIAEKFMDTLLRRKIANQDCTHYLIGSSSLHSYIINGYSMKQAHAIFQTPTDSRIIGAAGEEAFIRKNSSIFINHPFGIHKQMPWLCSSGDFLIKEFDRNALVEIKTSTSYESALRIYENPDQRILLQVWIQMEIFDVKYGKLIVYFFDRVSKLVNLVGVIELEHKASVFTSDFSIISVIRYVDFLKEYFEKVKIYPSQNYLEKLKLRLANNILMSMPQEPQANKNGYIRHFPQRLAQTCDYLTEQSKFNCSETKKPFVPFKTMFKNHRFSNRSKKIKIICFDEEFRTNFLGKLLSKINPLVCSQAKKLQQKVSKGLVKTDILSEAKLKQIELTHKKRRMAQTSDSLCQTKQLLNIIGKQRKQLKILRMQIKQLRHKREDCKHTFCCIKMEKEKVNEVNLQKENQSMKAEIKSMFKRSVSTRISTKKINKKTLC